MGALADDLNTPLVFTKMHGLAAAGKFPELLSSARFLGLLLSEPVTDELDALLTNHQKLKIENLLIERLTAKNNKDFIKADLIRKKLEDVGIVTMDQFDKTNWSLAPNFDIKKMEDLI